MLVCNYEDNRFLLDRMEKVSHPSVDYNSDNSDIGSEVYSHDESDIVSGASFSLKKKI